MEGQYFHHRVGEFHAHDNIYNAKDGFLTVQLYGNCTSGYQWEYSISDDDVLACHKSAYMPFKIKDCRCHTEECGAGGLHTMLFAAEDDGYCMLQFNYRRPWEKKPLLKKRLMVGVQNGRISVYELGNEHFEEMDGNAPVYPEHAYTLEGQAELNETEAALRSYENATGALPTTGEEPEGTK